MLATVATQSPRNSRAMEGTTGVSGGATGAVGASPEHAARTSMANAARRRVTRAYFTGSDVVRESASNRRFEKVANALRELANIIRFGQKRDAVVEYTLR